MLADGASLIRFLRSVLITSSVEGADAGFFPAVDDPSVLVAGSAVRVEDDEVHRVGRDRLRTFVVEVVQGDLHFEFLKVKNRFEFQRS